MYLRNTWYIAAEPQELASRPLARTILERPVVVFRTASGKVVALDDRCPHRFAPLSLGHVAGERIQCGYHGAQFDASGACVHVPGQDIVPRVKIASYPVVEKHGYVWIWMGDTAGAAD